MPEKESAISLKAKERKVSGNESEVEAGDAVGGGQAGTSAAKKNKKNKKNKKKPAASHPVSKIDEKLPIPYGITQHYFDAVKGKGFVATRDFAEGDVILTDEAFVAAPPMTHAKNVEQGNLCDVCFQPIEGSGVGLNVGCKDRGCLVAWCNRDCELKARSKHHNLLCRGNNPAVVVGRDAVTLT